MREIGSLRRVPERRHVAGFEVDEYPRDLDAYTNELQLQQSTRTPAPFV